MAENGNGNGNGYNGRFTAQQFIDAIPGTGGVISTIAERVGCHWNTAKKYIDAMPTVQTAWQNERNRITDTAKNNIIKAIEDDGDLQMSKWWLSVLDDEFKPKQSVEHRGGTVVTLDWGDNVADDDAALA